MIVDINNEEPPPDPLGANNKTILLVNTGFPSKEFILKRIKELGVNIIVLHKQINWAEPYISHWIFTDVSNHDQALHDLSDFLTLHPAVKIDGVITFCESYNNEPLLVAKIADKYGLKGLKSVVVENFKNKFLFRKFCEKYDVHAPKCVLIDSAKDLHTALTTLTFPVVVKPTHGSSSAFVIKADNKDDLIEKYVTKDAKIIVEEYISGSEVDIDILIQNGEVKFYSISDNLETCEPYFIETGFNIPSRLPVDEQDDLYAMAVKVLKEFSVTDGCIHFEAKSTKEGAVPIEVNLRMGGDEVRDFVLGAWGIDLIEQAIKIALGEDVKVIKSSQAKQCFAGFDLMSDHSGVVKRLHVDERIHQKSYLQKLEFFKKEGDTLLVPPDGYEYLGFVTVSGDTEYEAKQNLQEALGLINYEISKIHS